MGLESATYITDLVATNPVAGDPKSQGDDHFRLLKTVLQTCFPTASKALYNPTTLAKSANFTVLAANMNCTFVSTTSGGAFTYTLPTLAAGDAGWVCFFIKIGSDVNPYFVAPASGTIQSGDQSGLTKVRRCIPGVRVACMWTGSAWVIERATTVPIATPIHNWRAALPVGYETPNGATLASASTNYPDFFQANGSSGVLPDITGRTMAGKESAATRLTAAGSGIDGATKGATGGAESNTTVPAHTHAFGTLAVASHTHGAGTYAVTAAIEGSDLANGSSGPRAVNGSRSVSGTSGATAPAITGDTASTGSASVSNAQPTIVIPVIMVVE